MIVSEVKVCFSVPDQVGTLSQVGTKKISKGVWTILELFEPHKNHYLSFRSQRGFSLAVGTDLAHLGVFLKIFGRETALMNLCNVNGKAPDLKRHHPTQSE